MGPSTRSWVLADETIPVQPALDFISKWNAEHDDELHITLHHLLLRACARALETHPRLNRFVAGNRYYQRNGVYLSFSAKKEFSAKGGLMVLKRKFEADESLEDIVRDLRSRLKTDRSTDRTAQEREESLFLKLPGPVLSLAISVLRRLDNWNLLPRKFLEHDVFHASLFVANLGSLGMNAGWHHLYDVGNIAVFIVIGQPYDAAVVEDGQVVARKVIQIRFTFDERVEDGFNAGKAIKTLCGFLLEPETMI